MKIVHVCMCGPMTDGWNYQENMLVKFHKKAGYEVSVITSQWIWGNDGKLQEDKRSDYQNEYDAHVYRLPIRGNKSIEYKFKRFLHFYDTMEREQPDILFVHGCQFLDIWLVRKYMKSHTEVKLYIDNHADFSNSGTNWISKNILHRGIWAMGAKAIVPYTERFYGVLPARVDFLTDMYGLPKNQVDLLVMGADDEQVDRARAEHRGEMIRKKYHIGEQDFLVVTGGKIDSAKRQTIHLLEAVQRFKQSNVKLLYFGSIEDNLKEQVMSLTDGSTIQYAGWISVEESYDYFEAADLVCFPGRHSVFWEQAAGQGKPLLVKYWEGTTHVDVGGNARFLYRDSTEEIINNLNEIQEQDGAVYQKMKDIAMQRGRCIFSYQEIAVRAIT